MQITGNKNHSERQARDGGKRYHQIISKLDLLTLNKHGQQFDSDLTTDH